MSQSTGSVRLVCFLLATAAHGQIGTSGPCKGVPPATFTDVSGIDWRSNHSFGLGIEQKGTPKVGCQYAIRDWPIPFVIKTLTFNGTFSFGPHIPDHKLYGTAALARIVILPCGPGHGRLEESEPYAAFNANMNRVFDRGEVFFSNVIVGPLPPPCSDGSPQIMRVEVTVAGSGDEAPAELELWGRWE